MKRLLMLFVVTFTLIACDSDDGENSPATFSGTSAASVDINNGAANGVLSVSDSDDDDVFLPQNATPTAYGLFSITEQGSWSYTLDLGNSDVTALAEDATLTDTIFVSSYDGTTTPVIITIVGVYIPSPAQFSGDLSVSVTNNTSEALTGTVTVTDANDGESSVDPESNLATAYGTFSITETGNWTYRLDTTNPTITSLLDGSDFVLDIIQIMSFDGTTSDITISITGVDQNPTAKTKVAKISDTLDDDAGELRYRLDSAVLAGKMTVSFLREDGIVTSDGTSKDGFISLYGSSTSGANALLDLRIRESSYSLRNEGDVSISTPVNIDQWTDIEITWDATNATDSVTPVLTITIDGVDVTGGAFSSGSGTPSTVQNGVQFIAFKLGDTSAVIPTGSFLFDDFTIFSDLSGSTIQFEDDFESYSVGDSLGTDNADSPYHSATADTIVTEVDAREDGGTNPEPTDNQVVSITDTMDNDAGELRYRHSGSVLTGKMTVSFLRQEGIVTADGTSKDGFISLYGTSTSGANALVDLRIRESSYSLRNESDVSISTPVNIGEWTEVDISWDASGASDTVTPTLTITIDGVDVAGGAFSSGSGTPSTVQNGVQYVAFKLGDTSAVIPTGAFLFDNLVLTSTTDGSTVVFEDNFEGYSVGDSLSSDNENSPYHSATAEAVIVLE